MKIQQVSDLAKHLNLFIEARRASMETDFTNTFLTARLNCLSKKLILWAGSRG
jgi:hypothetical protein